LNTFYVSIRINRWYIGQRSYPVISLSFAPVKQTKDFEDMRRMIYEQYNEYNFLLNVDGLMDEKEKELLNGGTLHTKIDEQIVFNQLDHNESAIWSLLLASGYLKVEKYTSGVDTGNKPSSAEPERFYHGFVLGLMVELSDRYTITSNRESGFGRYDVVLKPKNVVVNDAITNHSFVNDAMIIEFKVHDAASLEAEGILSERIRKYGFAFEGKRVLIG